jgi:hypothetical protein
MWKRSKHKNIVPFLGVALSPLQLISEWISGGHLTEYIKEHPDADRLGLVCAHSIMLDPALIPTTSYAMPPKAFTFSTPTT